MVELAGFRAPDYVLLLTAYPLLLAVVGIMWLVTRVRPKGKYLSLRFRLLGLSFRIENGDLPKNQSEIGKDCE